MFVSLFLSVSNCKRSLQTISRELTSKVLKQQKS
uniref:Uncharacterized protein n=1 Tax=Rhizophora mucronata TaxID=61149 RepID=A0A2P2N570_RHIMU